MYIYLQRTCTTSLYHNLICCMNIKMKAMLTDALTVLNHINSQPRSLNSHLIFLMTFTGNGASWPLYSTNDAQ